VPGLNTILKYVKLPKTTDISGCHMLYMSAFPYLLQPETPIDLARYYGPVNFMKALAWRDWVEPWRPRFKLVWLTVPWVLKTLYQMHRL